MRLINGATALVFLPAVARAESIAVETEIPHPMISNHTEWMVIVLILAAAVFLAALIAGPVIRANTRQDETRGH